MLLSPAACAQVYNFVTIAGGGYSCANGTNQAARFWWPQALAVGDNGSLYVADSYNYTIRELRPVGSDWVSSTIAGWGGVPGDTDGTDSAVRFGFPAGVASDGAGNLFVADSGSNTIRRLQLIGTNWVSSTIAGCAGSKGTTDGTNGVARFNEPSAVVMDASGNLYVADSGNNRVRKITRAGTNWVTSSITCTPSVWLPGVSGIAKDNAGNLFLALTDGDTVQKLTPDGTNWIPTMVAGSSGVPGSSDGTNSEARFNGPRGIAVDASGVLYVSDARNNSIRKIVQLGADWVVSTISGIALNCGVSDGPSNVAQLCSPYGLAVGQSGAVFVADMSNSEIRKLTPVGNDWELSTIAGRYVGPSSADGTNTEAGFFYPAGIAADARSSLYVADLNNHTIRMMSRLGTNWVTSTIAGLAGSSGNTDGTNQAVLFRVPYATTVDSAGCVFVADERTTRRLEQVGTNWVCRTIAGTALLTGTADGTNNAALFDNVNGIAAAPDGGIYVTEFEKNTIRKLTPVGADWVTTTIAGVPGASAARDGTNRTALFNHPAGIAVDSNCDLFIADSGNHTIRCLTLTGTNWVSSTIAGTAGSAGGTDGTNSSARFRTPFAVALGSDGSIYVADRGNGTIRKLLRCGTNWVANTIGGVAGSRGGTDGAGCNARFASPSGIAIDTSGNIYIADFLNHAIRQGSPLPAPAFQASVAKDSQVLFTCVVTAGQAYRLQCCTSLPTNAWTDIGPLLNAMSSTLSFGDSVAIVGQRFYRLLLVAPTAP